MRAILYLLAKLLGDVNAVKKGKVGRRLGRRAVGKLTGRGLRSNIYALPAYICEPFCCSNTCNKPYLLRF
jgi:hypothetical protein